MKRFRFAIALALCISPAAAHAGSTAAQMSGRDPSDQSRLSLIIRSTSKPVLLKNIKLTSQMRRQRAFCEAELNSAALPVACFALQEVESRLDEVLVKKANPDREWLTRVCVDRVGSVTSWAQLRSALRAPYVSELCRTRIRERLEDLHYQAETDAPLRLFGGVDPESDWSGF